MGSFIPASGIEGLKSVWWGGGGGSGGGVLTT